MEDIKYLRKHKEELGNASSIITPICLVIDRSHSMKDAKFSDEYGYTRMDRLREGISQFYNELSKDDTLSDSVEISIVAFAERPDPNSETGFIQTWVEQEFTTLPYCQAINDNAHGSGDTPAGVELGLSLLEKEKQFLKDNRKRYNQPWIVIMSDGRATPSRLSRNPYTNEKDFSDINYRLSQVQSRVKALQANKKLTVISVLISEKNDGQYNEAVRQMRGFTNNGKCIEIGSGQQQISFKDFFEILSKSVSAGADLFNDEFDIKQDKRYTADDYVAQDQVSKYIKIKKPVETVVVNPVIETPVEESDSAKLLRKLQEEAAVEDVIPIEEPKQKPPIVRVEKTRIVKAKTVTTTTTNNSDDYLAQLLNGLDDWDDL